MKFCRFFFLFLCFHVFFKLCTVQYDNKVNIKKKKLKNTFIGSGTKIYGVKLCREGLELFVGHD